MEGVHAPGAAACYGPGIVELRFTFPDGALRYDCPSCGARCCKGLGIGLDPAMAAEVLARRPGLRALSRAVGPEVVAQNVFDGCWFLDGEGLCSLERDEGREAKPVACRLFPFNRIYRVGDVRVVDVNSYLCPVQEDTAGAGVRHSDLTDEINALGSRVAVGRTQAPDGHDPVEVLAAEATVLDQCTWLWRNGGQSYVELAAGFGAAGDDAATLAALRQQVETCLDVSPPLSDRASRRLALLTPSLRFNALFRGGDAAGDTLTRMLVAFDVILRAAWELSALPLSLRAITELWQSRVPALRTLAALDRPPAPSATAFQTDAPESLQGPYFTLVGMASANAAAEPLGSLLRRAAPDPLQRTLLLPFARTLAAS